MYVHPILLNFHTKHVKSKQFASYSLDKESQHLLSVSVLAQCDTNLALGLDIDH